MNNNKKVSLLLNIINTELDLDIREKRRTKRLVLGRYIFSRIARDSGLTLQEIGDILGITHCSVVHYMRHFDGYMRTDKTARNLYEIIKEGAPVELSPLYRMSVKELRDGLRKMEDQNKELSLIIKGLRQDVKRVRLEEERLTPLMNLIRTGVPKGKEEEARIKFNHIINGLR